MPRSRFIPHFTTATALLFASVLAISCTKKEEAAAPVASDPAPAAATAAAVQAPAATQANATALYAETEAALKAKEYEKAAQALLSGNKGPLSDSQTQAARDQMIRLQNAVAAGIAAGDPKAKAAADMLRRASTVR